MDFFFFFKWTKNIWRRKKGAAGVGRHWLINRRRKNGYRDAVQIFICVKKQRGSHTSRRAPDSISILPDQITPCEITHGSGVARNGMRAPFSAKGAAAPLSRERTRRIARLTSAGQEYLDGDVLEQISPREYRAHLREVPFSMQMVAVLEHLEGDKEIFL